MVLLLVRLDLDLFFFDLIEHSVLIFKIGVLELEPLKIFKKISLSLTASVNLIFWALSFRR